MKKLLFIIFGFFSTISHSQTILSASPLRCTSGDFFNMSVETSAQLANPYTIGLFYDEETFTWGAYNTSGNNYLVNFLVYDVMKTADYYLTSGNSIFSSRVRVIRPLTPQKFDYNQVQSLNMSVGANTRDGITFIQADNLGNLYGVGNFSGTLNINGNSVTASGSRDGFIVKYNSAGVAVWLRKIGSTDDDNASKLEALTSLKIYNDTVLVVTGYMRCHSSLKYNNTVLLNYPVANVNSQDGIVMKLDTAGNFKWAAFQGSLRIDQSSDLEIDSNGNIIATGSVQAKDYSTTGPADTSFTYVYNAGATDSITFRAYANEGYGLFVAKYTPGGQLIWAKRQSPLYGNGGMLPVRIKLCSDESIMFLAKGTGSLRWDYAVCVPGAWSNAHYTLTKLNTSGVRQWCVEDGNMVQMLDMGIDSLDNAYVVVPTTWTGGDEETFLRKYDATGGLMWSNHIQHNKEYNGHYYATTDAGGNTYVTHSYDTLWAGVSYVVVTKKFDSNGALLAVTFPEPYIANIENKPTAITLNKTEDKIFLAGHYKNSQKFGNTTLNSATTKPFLLKMENCNVSYDSIVVNSCGPYTTPSGNQTYYESGLFVDTLTNAAGCDSILLIDVNYTPAPTVTIAAQGAVTFCQGDSVTLSATPSLLSYQWYRRNSPIPGATSPVYKAKIQGRYFCVSQTTTVCTDTSNFIVVNVPCVPIGPDVDKTINENESPILSVFPNPGLDIITVNGPPGELFVFDAMGKLVMKSLVVDIEIQLNLKQLSGGIYTFCLMTEKKLLRKRFQLLK